MNKEKFIEELSKVTKVDKNKCIIINNILERHFIIRKKNKEKIINDIINELNFSEDESESIYESAMSIIGTEIKEKIKHPFKNQD